MHWRALLFYRWIFLALPLVLESVEIKLQSPYNESRYEYSGLAWHGSQLIVLPQYPDKQVYSVSGAHLDEAIASHAPLKLDSLPFDDTAIRRNIEGYEGYEAIAFDGDDVYALIEARNIIGSMWGYIAKGTVSDEGIRLNKVIRVETPLKIRNFSFEAMTLYDSDIYVMYEALGMMKASFVLQVDKTFTRIKRVPIDSVDFRLTDLTAVENRKVWAVNTYWPGDRHKLDSDRREAFAQLVEMRFSNRQITLTGKTFPILDGGVSHNYEGLVRLAKRGFIVITDAYPRTKMEFLPFRDIPSAAQ